MSDSITDHQPPKCILTIDGLLRAACAEDQVEAMAHDLARNNPDALIDIYAHMGTVRMGANNKKDH